MATTRFNILLGLGWPRKSTSTDGRLFMRNKFSVRMNLAMADKPSKSITFVVCKHDLASLELDPAHYSATQPFVSLERILPRTGYADNRSPGDSAFHGHGYLWTKRRLHKRYYKTSFRNSRHGQCLGISASQQALEGPCRAMES